MLLLPYCLFMKRIIMLDVKMAMIITNTVARSSNANGSSVGGVGDSPGSMGIGVEVGV